MGKLSGRLLPFLLITAAPRADWVPAAPRGGAVYRLHADGDFLLAKTASGFLASYDDGRIWSSLPSPVDSDAFILAAIEPALFLASTKPNHETTTVIWRSLDSAKSWAMLPPPPDSLKPEFGTVHSLFGCGRYLLAGSEGIFRSADRGNTWIRSKLPAPVYGGFTCFGFSGPLLYATSRGNTLVSSDSGATWTLRCGPTLGFPEAKILIGNGKSLLAAGPFIYRLGEQESTWTQEFRPGPPGFHAAMLVRGSEFLAAGNDTVYRSADDGLSWSPIGRVGAQVLTLADDGGALLAGTESGGIYRSDDGGISWNNLTVPEVGIRTLTACGGNLFAELSGGKGLYRSGDWGVTWKKTLDWVGSSGVPTYWADGFDVVGNGTYLHAIATADGDLRRSRDGGITWESEGVICRRLWQSGTALFAEKWVDFYKYPMHRSDDTGTTWIPISERPLGASLVSLGSILITATESNCSRSRDQGASWESFQVNLGQIKSMVACGNEVFAASPFGLLFSADSVRHWYSLRPDMQDISALSCDGSVLFAGRSPISAAVKDSHDPKDARILRSTDLGLTWTPVSEGFEPAKVTSLQVAGTDLFAGTADGWVWKRPLSELVPGSSAFGHGNARADRPGKRMLIDRKEKEMAIKIGLPLRDLAGRILLPSQAGSHSPAFVPARSPTPK